MAMLLLVTVFLPLAGSGVLFLRPQWEVARARSFALGTALATLTLSLFLLAAFEPGVSVPQFAFEDDRGSLGWRWVDRVDIRFALGLDGLSLWLFLLTPVLLITAIFSSWEAVTDRAPLHYALLLALETGLLGLFASLDVILFYIFFEFTLIPLFFLIGIWGGANRRRAALTFFLYTLTGSLLTLLGVIALVVIHYQYTGNHLLTFSIVGLTHGLSALPWPNWQVGHPWYTSPQTLIFLLLFAGFAIKVPIFPFHTWLPLAHVEAPTAGSILLAGVLLKVGSYGLLRFNLGMTPVGAKTLFPLIVTLAVIGIIYGALTALAQTDVKRLVAYSSVSHMGFIILGMWAFNATGLEGSMIQMVNHGVTTGALFACVGVFYERYHTHEMSELGGLWRRLPLLAFFFILAALGSAAVPGLNGFTGEFPILAGMFQTSPRTAVLGATGMIWGAYYLLWMLQSVLFGPLREPHHESPAPSGSHAGQPARVRPVAWHEIAGLAPLMLLIVLIGVYPAPIFGRLKASIRAITNVTDSAGVAKPVADLTGAPALSRFRAKAAQKASSPKRSPQSAPKKKQQTTVPPKGPRR